MNEFVIFPAIDLRQGRVVRLQEGDPNRETVFSTDPAEVAYRFLRAGARWLHVINLDGALGEAQAARANERAIAQILEITPEFGAQIQVGGGVRSMEAIARLRAMGVGRVILGTLAIQQPQTLAAAIARWGAEHIAYSLDLRQGEVQIQGWQRSAPYNPREVLARLADYGLRWVIYTDVTRDGLLSGANLEQAAALTRDPRLRIILAGGVNSIAEVQAARRLGLAGVIIGRALYDGRIDPDALFGQEEEVADAG
jgi:phosphoribosylformimino-5-aminoimidazole carboxamide ribotide isomerase